MRSSSNAIFNARESKREMFHALRDEVAEVATQTALRVQKILERDGRSFDDTGERDEHCGQRRDGANFLRPRERLARQKVAPLWQGARFGASRARRSRGIRVATVLATTSHTTREKDTPC